MLNVVFSALLLATVGAEARVPRAPVMDNAVMFQTVQNPSTVEFTASPDHNATDKGAPVVSRYDVEVYTQANQTTPVIPAIGIGKPTPNTSNVISYNQLRSALGPLPVGSYVVKIAAVGPGGTARSLPSAPFQEASKQPAVTGTPILKQE